MIYEILAQFAQTWGLIIFVIAFALVLIYALSPGRKKEFEDARQMPLNDDDTADGGENHV